MIRPPLDTVIASEKEKKTVTSSPKLVLCSLLGPVSSCLTSDVWMQVGTICIPILSYYKHLLHSLPEPVEGIKEQEEGAHTMIETKQDSAYPVHTVAWHPQPLPPCLCQHGATLRNNESWTLLWTEYRYPIKRELKRSWFVQQYPILCPEKEGLQVTGNDPLPVTGKWGDKGLQGSATIPMCSLWVSLRHFHSAKHINEQWQN